MTTISAKSVLASTHAQTGQRIDTLLLRYPRCIHSEFMTHRVFSRNAASSRAIPVSKLIQDVLDDPFVPLVWGANQKGMQAGEECNASVDAGAMLGFFSKFEISNRDAWLCARNQAVAVARAFDAAGYHKQIVNRLLEPFSHITVVVTATQWSNFLALRDHKDAEPHIQILAREMRKALYIAEVQTLQPGEWHLPFVSQDDYAVASGIGEPEETILERVRKLSVARCASTSYKTVDGFDMTMERAIALHDKLVASKPLHASPCEHQAQADWFVKSNGGWEYPEQHGNFTAFRQYRKMLPNECL